MDYFEALDYADNLRFCPRFCFADEALDCFFEALDYFEALDCEALDYFEASHYADNLRFCYADEALDYLCR